MAIYTKLRGSFGFQRWWPADTPFEVVVGAMLTQQTSWKNVEKAIGRLKEGNALTLDGIANMQEEKLEMLIRPCGYYRQKAKRLKETCLAIEKNYGTLEKFLAVEKKALRKKLLEMNGIGKETADSILLYAAEKRSFVVDAYTKRIVSRVFDANELGYDELKDMFESALPNRIKLYKDMHAQIVELGKRYCRKKPLCEGCPIAGICKVGKQINAI